MLPFDVNCDDKVDIVEQSELLLLTMVRRKREHPWLTIEDKLLISDMLASKFRCLTCGRNFEWKCYDHKENGPQLMQSNLDSTYKYDFTKCSLESRKFLFINHYI